MSFIPELLPCCNYHNVFRLLKVIFHSPFFDKKNRKFFLRIIAPFVHAPDINISQPAAVSNITPTEPFFLDERSWTLTKMMCNKKDNVANKTRFEQIEKG